MVLYVSLHHCWVEPRPSYFWPTCYKWHKASTYRELNTLLSLLILCNIYSFLNLSSSALSSTTHYTNVTPHYVTHLYNVTHCYATRCYTTLHYIIDQINIGQMLSSDMCPEVCLNGHQTHKPWCSLQTRPEQTPRIWDRRANVNQLGSETQDVVYSQPVITLPNIDLSEAEILVWWKTTKDLPNLFFHVCVCML